MADPAASPRQDTTDQPLAIPAEGVSQAFGDHVALRSISLAILRGQTVAIVGTSRSGSTVPLDPLTGLMRPDTGRVLVADHSRPGAPLVDIHALEWEALDAVRLSWAIVFQKNALFSGSVRDNIALWL